MPLMGVMIQKIAHKSRSCLQKPQPMYRLGLKKARFAKIAVDNTSKWHQLAAYLPARTAGWQKYVNSEDTGKAGSEGTNQ